MVCAKLHVKRLRIDWDINEKRSADVVTTLAQCFALIKLIKLIKLRQSWRPALSVLTAQSHMYDGGRALPQCCFNDGPHFQRSGDVETVLFQFITLITFEILDQTSPNFQGSRRNGAANGVCKITCKTVENWLRYQRKTLRRRCHSVGSVLCINNFWSTQ